MDKAYYSRKNSPLVFRIYFFSVLLTAMHCWQGCWFYLPCLLEVLELYVPKATSVLSGQKSNPTIKASPFFDIYSIGTRLGYVACCLGPVGSLLVGWVEKMTASLFCLLLYVEHAVRAAGWYIYSSYMHGCKQQILSRYVSCTYNCITAHYSHRPVPCVSPSPSGIKNVSCRNMLRGYSI